MTSSIVMAAARLASALTVLTSIPSAMAKVAKVCLRSWKVGLLPCVPTSPMESARAFLSVLSFVNAVSNLKEEQVAGIAVEMTNSLGSDRFNIWGMTPESVYPKIKECWDGIYNNMTANYCKDPSEWPMLFGITTQMIILKAIEAGAGAEEAGLMAMQCAYVISKMDDDSL